MTGENFNNLIVKTGLTPEQFSQHIDVGKSTVYKIIRGDTKKISMSMANKINKAFPQFSVEYILTLNDTNENKAPGESYFKQLNREKEYVQDDKQHILEDLKYKLTTNNNNKVPYYDIDVTSHITTSFSDVHETPSFYVDYKPFNDCTAYVNNYGDSMFPKYKNGEKLAVKQIHNFDVINWGETYLVITNGNANDMKTVKDVHPHEDFNKIILRASNPAYAGDTIINKEDILSMFAVKGKISQNFI